VKLPEALQEWRIRKMRKIKKEEESKVKDLVEKLQAGKLTPKEAKREMKRRRLSTEGSWKGVAAYFMVWVAYIILWLPFNFKFSAQLLAIRFPTIVIYISIVLLVFGTFVGVRMHYLHCKKGGLKGSDETIIFYRSGPYSVMRHPGVFNFMVWFIFLPIVLSAHIPFTILTVVAIIIIVVCHYYMIYIEEKISIKKWGNEYRQYMKEVPRFNFIKGLWNLRKKR
jgi:protein-S-isoprenylcysteine O-methyltransferase Ste14